VETQANDAVSCWIAYATSWSDPEPTPFATSASPGAMNKTTLPTPDTLERRWYVVDAADQTLGRLASEVASVLRGKNKPTYTPHLDTGDFVVVINAEKVRVSGNKATQKLYRRHSGRPGGMKTETFTHLQNRLPERIVEKAIQGMLPHNTLGRQLFRKLKVYRGDAHPHAAQQPQTLALDPAASAQ
jgi:large subunit ribosomal protein L13